MNRDAHKPKLRGLLRLGRALKLVWSVAPGWTTVSIGLTGIQGALPAAAVWLMKLTVDEVTAAITGSDQAGAYAHVALLVGLLAAIALAVVVVRSLQTLVSETLAQVVTDHVTDFIHAQSVAVDLEHYESPRYHDVLFRAQLEAPHRPSSMVHNLTTTGQAFVSLVAMAGLLLTLHWAVGLIVIVATFPAAVVRFYYSSKLYSWQRRRTEVERQSHYAHWLLTDSGHAKEIRLFDLGDRFRSWYLRLRHQLRREVLRLAARRSVAEMLAGAAAVAAVFGTFAFVAWRTVQGEITVGMMVAYYQALQTSLGSLQGLMRGVAALYEDTLFLTYYEEFMSLQPHVLSPAEPRRVPRPISKGLQFDSVHFSYPGTDRTALRDVSLTIRPGEVTALVGPNGSGKTTVVKLLCRLYDPTAGMITLDGIDLRSFGVAELRKHMSVMFQDFTQYLLTARENIRLGNVGLDPGDPAIEKAARDADVHDAIMRLRQGYDTVLGRWFEEGEELSIGEWQKIALARTFVRDAQILVFDEPTSTLDPQAESEVFRHIQERAQGRAIILISHRFSTVRDADRIHIFDQGCIVESGSHEELLALDGRYATMYRVQAQGYRGAK